MNNTQNLDVKRVLTLGLGGLASLFIITQGGDKISKYLLDRNQYNPFSITQTQQLTLEEQAYLDLITASKENFDIISREVTNISLPYAYAIAIHEGGLIQKYLNFQENTPVKHTNPNDKGWFGINKHGAYAAVKNRYAWNKMGKLEYNVKAANKHIGWLDGKNILEVLSQYHNGRKNKKDIKYASIVNAHAGIIASALKKVGKWNPHEYHKNNYFQWYQKEGMYLDTYKAYTTKKDSIYFLQKPRNRLAKQ